MIVKIVLINLFLLVAYFAHGNKTDSLLQELNLSIKNRDIYFSKKENKLSELKNSLNNSESLLDQFQISQELMQEYSYYNNDSALYYSKKSIMLATEIGNKNQITECLLDKAELLSNSELFYESFSILQAIDINDISDKNKAKYYKTYIYVLRNQINDINDLNYTEIYDKELRKHIDIYLSCELINSFDYKKVLAYKHYLEGTTHKVEAIIAEMLHDPKITSNQHAELLLHLGQAYIEAGTEYKEKAKQYLILASMEYNQYAIIKNPALVLLAEILHDEEDSKRAYEYIGLALQDARKFNNNHTIRDIEKVYYLIQDTYYAQIKQQQQILRTYLMVLTMMFIIFGIIIISFYKKNRELKKTKIALSESILNLQESGYILETFVGHYLDLYYSYIIKLNDYRRYILKKLNARKYEELIKSETNIVQKANSDEDKIFSDFDKTFLSIYPHFISSVNKLLHEDSQYNLKYNKKDNTPRLSTEIRILALLKLGISDSKKIALFLRISVQSVYNCRSKVRSKAIKEDSFENDIKAINNIKQGLGA